MIHTHTLIKKAFYLKQSTLFSDSWRYWLALSFFILSYLDQLCTLRAFARSGPAQNEHNQRYGPGRHGCSPVDEVAPVAADEAASSQTGQKWGKHEILSEAHHARIERCDVINHTHPNFYL